MFQYHKKIHQILMLNQQNWCITKSLNKVSKLTQGINLIMFRWVLWFNQINLLMEFLYKY